MAGPTNILRIPTGMQANNKRSNRVIEFDGKSATLQEWADDTGILRGTIAARISAGWSIKESLSRGAKPPRFVSGVAG